ncbi:zinc-binding alcohol dehydrogenase [Ktedonosporobacter rubrisoli]|uniref:Zinc-binding alcohol dehydrogenase n=1 Tax=Ktedonosporobacter rubrisoli TaxID=2509675 RepID=A0A4P6K556_KTERU|nr:zinc-binding alcohol dehydrogenase [Ktedonosporobacter rubrisoli]QBD82666.1 zinc-binding alcohol dehydrogenase [Ktedonosporobacter rubrisoli]
MATQREDVIAESLLLVGARQLEWIAEKLPQPAPDEVLIRTRAGAMSIGSELPIYCGCSRDVRPAFYPRMTGYESLGIVQACGAAVQDLRPGDRVVAFYGHRTYALVPAAKAIKVPEHVSDELALLTILTCDAAKGVRKLALQNDESVLLAGAGAIGLFALFVLNAYGIAAVDVVEPRRERYELARALGARRVMSPQDISSASASYSAALECSSSNEAFALLQRQVIREGRICILADGNRVPLVLLPEFHAKELLLVGSSDGWDYQAHAEWFFAEAGRFSTALRGVFELRIKREQLHTTFEQLATEAIHPIKVLISYKS